MTHLCQRLRISRLSARFTSVRGSGAGCVRGNETIPPCSSDLGNSRQLGPSAAKTKEIHHLWICTTTFCPETSRMCPGPYYLLSRHSVFIILNVISLSRHSVFVISSVIFVSRNGVFITGSALSLPRHSVFTILNVIFVSRNGVFITGGCIIPLPA